jgi:hypothetical protein
MIMSGTAIWPELARIMKPVRASDATVSDI